MREAKIRGFMLAARSISIMSTCPRRSVGCVVLDGYDRVIATGYNGVPRGIPHCTEVSCPGAHAKHGDKLDDCQATHAEINALTQCSDVQKATKMFTTSFPCISCFKAIMNTGIHDIYYTDEYPSTFEAVSNLNKLRGNTVRFHHVSTKFILGKTELEPTKDQRTTGPAK